MLCINKKTSTCCICYNNISKFNYCNNCPTQICYNCRIKINKCPVCRNVLDNKQFRNTDKFFIFICRLFKFMFFFIFFVFGGRYICYRITNDNKYFIPIGFFILTSLYGTTILLIFIILLYFIVMSIWVLFVTIFGLFSNNSE